MGIHSNKVKCHFLLEWDPSYSNKGWLGFCMNKLREQFLKLNICGDSRKPQNSNMQFEFDLNRNRVLDIFESWIFGSQPAQSWTRKIWTEPVLARMPNFGARAGSNWHNSNRASGGVCMREMQFWGTDAKQQKWSIPRSTISSCDKTYSYTLVTEKFGNIRIPTWIISLMCFAKKKCHVKGFPIGT